MKSGLPVVFLLLACLTGSPLLPAQTYLKTFANSEQNFNVRIGRFANGDVLLGDSSIEPLRSGEENGILYLSRLDNCGRSLWSYQYETSEGYLELKDFVINEQAEVFAYGSFYRGLNESLFLLKIDGTSGEDNDLLLWDTGTVDHFSYTIDYRNGHIMIYGLVLDFQTQKQGFVALLDEDLNLQWAQQFSPFESNGAAILTADGSILGRSGAYLFKMNAAGDLLWAQQLDLDTGLQILRGPVATANGYLFEGNIDDQSFIFKIDEAGKLVWTSDCFASNGAGLAMSAIGPALTLCTFARSQDTRSEICRFELTAEGNILNPLKWSSADRFSPGNIYQSIDEGQVSIAINDNPFATAATDFEDFVLQFPLESGTDEDCLQWEPIEDIKPNALWPGFHAYTFQPEAMALRLEQRIEMAARDYPLPWSEQCRATIDPSLLTQDTLLSCAADAWSIRLPGKDFFWLDGSRDTLRQMTEAGTLLARNKDCVQPVEIRFRLERAPCPCSIYLPSAFSPNGDGINDQLALYADCQPISLHFTIFDRWGNRVFTSQTLNASWDGTIRQKPAPAGSYLARLRYTYTGEDETPVTQSLTQEVTLLR